MGACPSRSLARNAALTGAVFTCCPAIAAAPVPGCFRSPGTRHSVCRPRILSPDPAVSAAPARFFFLPLAGQDFLSTMQKNTCIFKLT